MSRDRHSLADLAGGARVYWLLDLSYAGGVLRVADADLEITDDDGNDWRYTPGLESVDMTEAIELLSDMSASPTSATIAAWLPVDVARMSALGHDLSAATGALYRWIEGTSLDARKVMLRGTVSDPEYDSHRSQQEIDDGQAAAGSPVRFSLTANVWQDETTIPGSSSAVIAENWDDAMVLSLAESDFNLAYPIIVGRPGVVSTALASSGWTVATRPVWVDKRKVLHGANFGELTAVAAGHHVTADECYLTTDSYSAGERFVVHNTYDRNNHPVAIIPAWVSLNAAGDDPYDYDVGSPYNWGGFPPYGLGVNSLDASYQPGSGESANLYAAWQDDASGGGGMRARDGSTMELAGDVLEWLLGLTTVPVDYGRCAVAKQLLQGYRLGFAIEAGVNPWKWAREHIVPLLPVTIVSGPNGLYPLVWRYWATATDAVVHLDATTDIGIQRNGPVKTDRSKIANDFALDYAYNVKTGSYLGRARLGAEGVDAGLPSLHCTLSQRRYRRPDGDPLVVEEQLKSVCVYDDATAALVLQWRALAYALARRRVTYLIPENRYGNIERGQVATITDPELYLSSQVALVESVKTDGSPYIEVGLLIIEDPVRDARLGALS